MATQIQRNQFVVNKRRKHQRIILQKIKAIVFDHDGTLLNTTVAPRAIFDGIKEMLQFLREKEIKLYVWTARGRSSTVEILESLDIIGQFELLSCAGEAAPKPSAQGISDILLDVDPKQVIVIGDSVGDMIGSRAFGAFSIGAMWAHGSLRGEQVMKDNGADICFEKVEDCLNYLKNRLKNKIEE